MNDPTKRIDVEKSSLLSLKAELLRKQEEVLKNKKTVPAYVKQTSKKLLASAPSIAGSSKSSGGAKMEEYEDSNLMSRSRKILEAKAKYYDQMMKNKGTTNSDDHSLVLFNRKTQMERDDDSDEDEMVEYTDCFGRTRNVLRKDLKKIKEQSHDLSEVAESRDQQTTVPRDKSSERSSESSGELSDDDKGSIIGPDVGLQFMKQRDDWERQEEVNKERPNLHYQDVLFDEAREHGVGFYEFSTDHEEREKQQEALSKIRDGTLEAQQQRADLKKSRDNIIANRVKLAKARVRARLGLPPEEEKPEESEENLYDVTDKKREKEEEAAKKKEKEEKVKERERQKHIRPWDRKKLSSKRQQSDSESEDEIEWKPRKEYQPLSQDEWNEKQRLERKQEFAPIEHNFVKAAEPYNPSRFEDEEPESSPFYSTTKKFKRRNASPEQAPVQRGAAIPPPPTFEYFGPSTSKHSKPPPPPENLEASISAGLKYLREQSDKANKHKWSAASEYSNNS